MLLVRSKILLTTTRIRIQTNYVHIRTDRSATATMIILQAKAEISTLYFRHVDGGHNFITKMTHDGYNVEVKYLSYCLYMQ